MKKNMKTLKRLTLLVIMSASISALGQTTTANVKEAPYIEVTGTAEIEIIPDEIYIAITIRERHEGRVKITIEKQESDLKEGLIGIGISLNNLSLTDANADYVKVKWTKKDVITKTEYILKVENALTVGKVFEKLDELKINDANISRVSHSKLEEFKKEVRIMAIKSAKEKADYLLTAIGEETGMAMIVHEQSSSYQIDDSMLNVRGARSQSSYYYIDGMKVSGNESEIQFQKIKLQAAIYVKFEIK
jgi:uncharacterized protein YggE